MDWVHRDDSGDTERWFVSADERKYEVLFGTPTGTHVFTQVLGVWTGSPVTPEMREAALGALRTSRHVDTFEGGYYVIDDVGPDGVVWFSLLKVLRVDRRGVHIRLYDDWFTTVPTAAHGQRLDYAVGHLPVTHQQFDWWLPTFVFRGAVTQEELDDVGEFFDVTGFWGPPDGPPARLRGLPRRGDPRRAASSRKRRPISVGFVSDEGATPWGRIFLFFLLVRLVWYVIHSEDLPWS
jgi:hypothetical protein